jgi:hypothetical protein
MTGYFATSDFSEIEGLLREKFGKPTEVAHMDMNNAFGAVFKNTIETWRSATGDVITLFRYIDAESGSLDVRSTKSIAADTDYRKAHAAEGKI